MVGASLPPQKDVNELDLGQLQLYKQELIAADEKLRLLLGNNISTSGDYNQEEIHALHRYNEMKDFAQAVIGYLANVEGATSLELHQRFNLPID